MRCAGVLRSFCPNIDLGLRDVEAPSISIVVNILLINHHAGGPAWGMEERPHGLAREWVKLGHEVTIAAASYSHHRSVQPEVSGAITTQACDGIKYRWYATPEYGGDGVARMRNVRAFLTAVGGDVEYLSTTPKPDVVIAASTYPQDIKVAKKIARACHALLVVEINSLWSLALMALAGKSRLHPQTLFGAAAERSAYRDADLVVSTLPKVHGYMHSRGLDLMKLHVMPTGVSTENWAAKAQDPLRADVVAAIERARTKGYTLVDYAGSMGLHNTIDTLLDAAELLRHERFAFVLVGDGSERERLHRRSKDAKLGAALFLPTLPRAQIPAFLAAIDMAYVGHKRSQVYEHGIASDKVMDCMVSGCVVLHAAQEGNDLVREAECGMMVPPGDATAVARGLRQLALLTRRERVAMGTRGQAYVQAHHTYQRVALRYVEVLEQTLERRQAT